VPIWKKEYYQDGDSGWVNCERCAAAAPQPHDTRSTLAQPTQDHDHGHGHDHGHDHAHDDHDEHRTGQIRP